MLLNGHRSSVIDFWRGFSSLGVALFHAREILWIGLRQYISLGNVAFDLPAIAVLATLPATFGFLGVPFFFVLSGYCIHASHGKALMADKSYRLNIRRFAWKRAVRIYPPFCAALVITAALDTVSRSYLPDYSKLGDISLYAFFMNLLTLQNITVFPYGSNTPLWSLAVEMHIYIAYPLLFALRRRTGLLGSMAVIALINLLSLAITMTSSLAIFTNYLTVWWAGAIVAEQSERMSSSKWVFAGLGLIAAGCAALQASELLAFQLGGVGFAVLLSGSFRFKLIPLLGGVFITLGQFSYSLYLIHLPVLVLIASVLYSGVRQPLIYAAIAGVLASIGVAYILYLLVERSSLRLASSVPLKPIPGFAPRG